MAKQEDYERLSSLSYPDPDVILMCFSIDSPDSLEDIPEKWKSDMQRIDYRSFCLAIKKIFNPMWHIYGEGEWRL